MSAVLIRSCLAKPFAIQDGVEEAVSPSIVRVDVIAQASFVAKSEPFRDFD